MTAFYYVAVSNSAKRKMVGRVEAASEKEARNELNKIGLAILTLSPELLPDWSAADAFEFASVDKTGKKIEGEIDAGSAEQAYDRLATELGLDPKYICQATASEEEKAKARETSVREILAKKAETQKDKKEAEMRTIAGGLKSLVRLAEGEHKDATEEGNSEKFSGKSDSDLTKKTEADFAKPEEEQSKDHPQIKPGKIGSELKSKEDLTSKAGQQEADPDEEPEGKGMGTQIQNFRKELSTFFPGFRKKMGKFYFHLTEVVVPSEGKTRKDALREIWNLFSPPKLVRVTTTSSQEGFFSPMHRKAILQRFWIVAENVSDVLAAIFLSYLAVGFLALRFEMGVLTELAAKTLPGNLLIPFLAFVFIFFRVLIFIRDKWTSWSAWRTSLLFAVGSVVVVFVGINFL